MVMQPPVTMIYGKSDDKATKKRAAAAAQAAEERLSLIDDDGLPTASPDQREQMKRKKKKGRHKKGQDGGNNAWSLPRLMRYLSLTCFSAVVTYFVLKRENKVLHWEEHDHLLQPKLNKRERCYFKDAYHTQERCSCPDPAVPQPRKGNDAKEWINHHHEMVNYAKITNDKFGERKLLDIVFIGDSFVERWNGTRSLGQEVIPGMRTPFEKRFTRTGGGAFEGIALGSSGDTGPNILWHLENGILETLTPKVWFVIVGSNDLYTTKCTDRIILANILNVIKKIQISQPPTTQIIVHGILPRVETEEVGNDKNGNAVTKTTKEDGEFLGETWQRAKNINNELKKFCAKASKNIRYVQSARIFLSAGEKGGRTKLDKSLIKDGIHPTKKGLDVWGNYLVKKIHPVIHKAEKMEEDLEETS